MARVKRAVNAHKKRRVILERASGYRGQRSRLYRKAKEQVTHSLVYAYRDRRRKKRDFRALWIVRLNAAFRAPGLKNSKPLVLVTFLQPGGKILETETKLNAAIPASLNANSKEAR